jgi:adenine/guanine phosphoribosyltransferase-like PRPP-binding protein
LLLQKRGLPEIAKGIILQAMIIIRFADQEAKRRALGYIARRFPGKSWATVMVPEAALASLAAENFHFTVEGQATYERLTSLRDTPAAAVQ